MIEPIEITFFEKIESRAYNNYVTYPHDPPEALTQARDKAEDDLQKAREALADWRASSRKAYNEAGSGLLVQFRKDLEEEYGMTGHPKAQLIYSKAWEAGHASGFMDVAIHYSDMVELVK